MNFDKLTILDETDESIIEPINIDIACNALSNDSDAVKHTMAEYAQMKNAKATYRKVRVETSAKHAAPFSMPAISKRTDFPNHITHRDITTKPEDQGSLGTCAMWTATTVCEMILWKLTGKYMEFSDDEIYNIYLDCQNAYYYYWLDAFKNDHTAQGRLNRICRVSNICKRRNLRKPDVATNSAWTIPSQFDNGEIYYRDAYGQVLGQNAFKSAIISPWYQILHYNDEDHRKNHYPNKFSEICFIAKNYINDSIFKVYNTTGNESDQLSPSEVKHFAFCSNYPMKCGLSGHAVAFYGIDNQYLDLNTSWNNASVNVLRFPYQNTKPYYSKCINTKTNRNDSRFSNGLLLTEYFDRQLDSTATYKLRIANAEHVKVIGTAEVDEFKSGHVVSLSAVPDDGYYFQKWSDGLECSLRNVVMTSDIVLSAKVDTKPNVNIRYHITYASSELFDLSSDVDIDYSPGYSYGQKINIKCIPANNAKFIDWGDGITENPRTFTVTHDMFISPVVHMDANDITQCIVCPKYDAFREFYGYSVDDDSICVIMFSDDPDENDTYTPIVLSSNTDYRLTRLHEDIYSENNALCIALNGINTYTGSKIFSFDVRRIVQINIYICIDEYESNSLSKCTIKQSKSLIETYGSPTIYLCKSRSDIVEIPVTYQFTTANTSDIEIGDIHQTPYTSYDIRCSHLFNSIYPTDVSAGYLSIDFSPTSPYAVVNYDIGNTEANTQLSSGLTSMDNVKLNAPPLSVLNYAGKPVFNSIMCFVHLSAK